MKKYILGFLLLFMFCATASAQSYYKQWLKQEKRDATYSKKEIKKAAKEYAKLIYENAKELKKARKDWVEMSEKRKAKKKKDLFAQQIQNYRNQRFKTRSTEHSLEEQTMNEIDLAYDYNPKTYFPEKIEGQAKVISKTYDAALEKAMTMAKDNLANQIVEEVMSQFAFKDFVKVFGLDIALEMTQIILDAREPLAHEIGEVITAVEIYNSKNYASTEVIVKVFYDGTAALFDFNRVLDASTSENKDLVKVIKSFLNDPIDD